MVSTCIISPVDKDSFNVEELTPDADVIVADELVIIVPFLFDVPQLKISVYQASDRAGIQTSNLQKIKDVNFEINVEG